MKHIVMVPAVLLILFTSACRNQPESAFTTVTVKEVEQVSAYTYLLVKENRAEYWVAVPTMEAEPGEVYHYQGGMLMTDFHSKDLDRTFEEVTFVEVLYPGRPEDQAHGSAMQEEASVPEGMTPGSTKSITRSAVEVDALEGTVSIAELYADPAAFEGRTIKVRGEVVRYNPAIMERNWVHIQDGTEYEGRFDLTLTSVEPFEVGSVVTVEGVVALNRDFGYGYSYEILLEEATAIE
jgi:hypothetical protein